MDERRVVALGEGLPAAVQQERERLREAEGLELSLAQTAARLIRVGLTHIAARRNDAA